MSFHIAAEADQYGHESDDQYGHSLEWFRVGFRHFRNACLRFDAHSNVR